MVKQKKIIDFISELEVQATPEEIDAVQVFAKQLVEDYGYSKDQIMTHPQFRVKSTPADTIGKYPVDIAVFLNSQKKEDEVSIIVECKNKNRMDGRGQLEDYLRLSKANLGVWFNGSERFFLRKIEKGGKVFFDEIPNLPKAYQRIEDIGQFKRKELKPTHNLKIIFKSIRNHLAANTIGVTRDEVLAQQLINLIFCKLYDERFTHPEENTKFRAGVDESTQEVEKRILELFKKVQENQKEIFEVNEKIILDTNSVAYVVGELQNYSLIDSERDVVADAFETFIGHTFKGSQGQFFTPRNVVKMIIDILNPGENDQIIDPACGSGGFLIESLKYVWKKIEKKYVQLGWSDVQIENKKIEIATKNFRGIDKDNFLTKVAKAYMNLLGDGKTGIFCEDTLQNPQNWSLQTRSQIQLGAFDILMTNPPFGSKISVTGEAKLKEFELGYKWEFNKKLSKWYMSSKLKTQEEPQVLFIEKCFQLLKDGGRMAIILPNGILGNEKQIYLREYIQRKGYLFAIVELPLATFSPNVTIHTSVLFIKKATLINDEKKLFISINKFCGHNKKGRPINKDDILEVSKFYHNNLSNENNFFINSSKLELSFVAKRYLKKYVKNINEINNSKYPVVFLATLLKSIHNGANIDNASSYAKEGIPYILVRSISKEGINFENLKYIKKDFLTKELIKNTVTEATIVMTRAGKPGIFANIPPDLVNSVASGFLMNIHVDLKKVNQYYLVAYLNSRIAQLQLERISSGSILTSIRSSDLKQILVILPPMEIQKVIGDKIKEAVFAKAYIRKKIKTADMEINNLIQDEDQN